MGINRFEVNAAIEQLLAGTESWEEHARVIIRNCHELHPKKMVGLSIGSLPGKDEESITGHSPGVGNVTVKDEQKKEREGVEFGIYRERIGYFKVWRQRGTEIGLKYWWKADLETQNPDEPEQTPEYYLGYDKETLQPKYFGVEREKKVMRFLMGTLYRVYLEPMYGEVKYPSRGWSLAN